MMRRSFLALTGVSAAASLRGAEAAPQARRPPRDPARLAARNRDRSAVIAQHGMVCASQPLAALVTSTFSPAGGMCSAESAIASDAALGEQWSPRAAAWAAISSPSCGAGEERRLYGLNASGRAPLAWTLEKARESRAPRRRSRRQSPLFLERARLRQRLAGPERALRPPRSRPACSSLRSNTRVPGFPVSPIIASHFSSWRDAEYPHLDAVYHPGGQSSGVR